MPELPEVETTKRGISPYIEGKAICDVYCAVEKLRYPVSALEVLVGQTIESINRRAKYLLLTLSGGQTLVWHLGMSGSFLISKTSVKPNKHEHIQLRFDDDTVLRYSDPRKFGCVLLLDNPWQSTLLKNLGPEPLEDDFNATYLKHRLRYKNTTIKQAIMDNKIVVGVGNIYASEALFKTGVRPNKKANKLTVVQCETLVIHIKQTLSDAIAQGGTTLKDFTGGDGKPGYFAQNLNVYGRAGQSCWHCKEKIKKVVLGQRSTYYCPRCQL